jgi:hypothetical protein
VAGVVRPPHDRQKKKKIDWFWPLKVAEPPMWPLGVAEPPHGQILKKNFVGFWPLGVAKSPQGLTKTHQIFIYLFFFCHGVAEGMVLPPRPAKGVTRPLFFFFFFFFFFSVFYFLKN